MTGTVNESALIAALRAGDDAVFTQLVDRYSPSMLRIARGYVKSHESAEEVVQDVWIAVVKGIAKFEGRSTIRTWLFAVLVNIAKARAIHERRDAEHAVAVFTGRTVDPARFRPTGDQLPGHWKEPPAPFPRTPERSVLDKELITIAEREIERLPEGQRIVVSLRDMLGFDSNEVCELLSISKANQRVLLHRGRAAVRQELEDYLGDR